MHTTQRKKVITVDKRNYTDIHRETFEFCFFQSKALCSSYVNYRHFMPKWFILIWFWWWITLCRISSYKTWTNNILKSCDQYSADAFRNWANAFPSVSQRNLFVDFILIPISQPISRSTGPDAVSVIRSLAFTALLHQFIFEELFF